MSSMTDSGRGSKDSRRRSSKQHSKSSQISSPASRSRPKSDLHATTSRSTKQSTTAGRPLLQDRTQSEPVETADDEAPPTDSTLKTPAARSETFLPRPSIDHAGATAISSAELTRSNVDGNGDVEDGFASGEDLVGGMVSIRSLLTHITRSYTKPPSPSPETKPQPQSNDP